VVFEARKEKIEASDNERQKQVRRAVLLIKRARGSQSADAIEKVALWKLEQAIPDSIKQEAYEIAGGDHSGSGAAEGLGRREDSVKSSTVGEADAQPATEDTASLLRDITSQANVIQAMAADLKAAGVEVTEEQVKEYLAGVDFDSVAKQVEEAPA
jgi:hypothetical protein